MATIENLRAWITGDLGRFAPEKTHILNVGQEVGNVDFPDESAVKENADGRMSSFRIYTDTNCYMITAKERADGGYLGCTSHTRKPRAGEDWHRGHDLADGKLTAETWRRILADIVSYELVRVHDPREAQKRAELPAEYVTP